VSISAWLKGVKGHDRRKAKSPRGGKGIVQKSGQETRDFVSSEIKKENGVLGTEGN